MKGSCPACSASIDPSFFACRRHWFAPPMDIRRGIWAGDLDSFGDALEWYRAHPDPKLSTAPERQGRGKGSP